MLYTRNRKISKTVFRVVTFTLSSIKFNRSQSRLNLEQQLRDSNILKFEKTSYFQNGKLFEG